jgi:putative ABC transport system permease protein
MILAIASIMTPLLILFGLKYGTIETFRHRLLENPKNREMRPLTSRAYDKSWFTEVADWPGVAFVIPYTRQMSATLDAYADSSSAAPVSLDIIPSGAGDAWLESSGLPIPADGQAILSASAAEALKGWTGRRGP